LFIAGTAVTLYTSANVIFLGLLSTATQTAFYSTAEKIVRAAPRVFSPVATAVYPRIGNLIARGEERRAARLTQLTLLLLFALSGAIAIFLIVFAEPIVRLLYGEAFEPSIQILRILALTLPMMALSVGLAQFVLVLRHMDREAVTVVVIAGVANVVLALSVTASHGALGLAWALVAVELVALAGNVVAILRADQTTRAAVSFGK
jgi:PST family polysaccharide transporter